MADLGGFRQRLVLALLLLHAGGPTSTDRLIEEVWGAQPPPTARKTLQVYVSRLRRTVAGDDIVATRDGYALQTSDDEVDAVVFEHRIIEARRVLERDAVEAADMLREALALWRGAPWGDLADVPALRDDADRLEELRLAALEDRLVGDLAAGRERSVTGELQSLVDQHPFRERLRVMLMVALYRQGRSADALQLFEEARAQLADELGTDPGAELQRAHERILRQDPDLRARRSPRTDATPPTTANPYKGLRPFTEADAEDFFGRERLVEELLAEVAASSLLVLVGPSGSGKSSVARAGVLPAVRSGALDAVARWRVAVMVPGPHPFAQLEAALVTAIDTPDSGVAEAFRGDDLDLLRAALRVAPQEGDRLLLVIDQFEELFLQTPEGRERQRFIRNLAEAVEDPHSRLHVVTLLRADMLERPMGDPRLGPLLTDALVHVLPLTPAELETACVAPAARAGVTIQPELATELVAEVAHRPAVLPMLQYTLTELFDRREAAAISLQDYRRLGGVQGVVARRAEATYGSLDDDARTVCRQVFLRLVAVGDGAEPAKRRAGRAELASLTVSEDDVVTVLERFGATRLLAFDRDAASGEPTVELAHEALLRAWPRLRDWIQQSREDLRVQRSVSAAAAEWEAAARDEGYLLSGARLDRAEEWRHRPLALPTTAERAFIDASRERRERERTRESTRHRHELELERRASSRLRQLTVVLTAATVVALLLVSVAVVQWSRAEVQTAAAQDATEQIRARQLASTSVATRRVDPDLSVLLALHAIEIARQADTEVPGELVEALHFALQARRVPFPGDAPVAAVGGPDGPQGVFPLPLEELAALADTHVVRELSAPECRRYLGTEACSELSRDWTGVHAEELQRLSTDPERPMAGTRVTMLTILASAQEAGLQAELDLLHDRTGIQVELIGLGEAELLRQVAQGRPPDLATIAQPALLQTLVEGGGAIDLGRYLDVDRMRAVMAPHLLSLGTVGGDGTWPAADGALHGVPLRLSNKSTVWYSLPAFEEAGYEIPATYDRLVELTDRMVLDGHTPWCHGEGSGAASGWPGTDLIENLLLHDSLADYDAWLGHELDFASPPVRRAFERMARLLLEPGHLAGGPATAATLDFAASVGPLVDDPPGCLLYPQGSDAQVWLPFGVEPGRDVGVFPFPPVSSDRDPMVLGAGDFLIAFHDRPEVREVVATVLREEFGRAWATVDPSFMSARRDFPPTAYVRCDSSCGPDPVRTALAPTLTDALEHDRFRFDGSDLLPHGVGLEPMWETMVEFVGEGPGNLDRLLTELDDTWRDLEAEANDPGAPASRAGAP